jgi:hypothetical protein
MTVRSETQEIKEMANTPHPGNGDNVETMKYPVTAPPAGTVFKPTPKASYTPSAAINPFSYGKDGGKANAVSGVPSVQVGGSFETAPLPSTEVHFVDGVNKNVSTPVSGL